MLLCLGLFTEELNLAPILTQGGDGALSVAGSAGVELPAPGKKAAGQSPAAPCRSSGGRGHPM